MCIRDRLGEELMTSYCREIAEEYQLPMPKMNSKYFAYASKSFDFALMAGVIALVLIGGYIVIQSIFRISIKDVYKRQSPCFCRLCLPQSIVLY